MKAEIWKQKLTVTSVAVATMKFVYGMRDWMVDRHGWFFAHAEDFAHTKHKTSIGLFFQEGYLMQNIECI